MSRIEHRKVPLPEDDFHGQIIDILDDVKEHIPDGKYLELCNKLKESKNAKYMYIQLKIHKDFKKLIKKEYPDIYPLIHKITLEINKESTDEGISKIDKSIRLYAQYYIVQMKDNIINLALKKLVKQSNQMLKHLKEENPEVDEKELKAFILLKSNCKCCSLVNFKLVQVCRFIEKKELS